MLADEQLRGDLPVGVAVARRGGRSGPPAGSVVEGLDGPFAGMLAGRLQLDPCALGERLHPEVGEETRARSVAARARRDAGVRVSAIRRGGGGRGRDRRASRDRPRRSIASAYRSAASPSSARSARERAATPSAQSVPLAASHLASRGSTPTANSRTPLRTAASISSAIPNSRRRGPPDARDAGPPRKPAS